MIIKHTPVIDMPNIEEYSSDTGLEVKAVETWGDDNFWHLYQDGIRWNTWNTLDHQELKEVAFGASIAYGKVIATGLGFLLRETLLLHNPNVNEVVVLEINKDLIEYQERVNPEIMKKITVVHCDANEYKGQCDTLLIDHYENLEEQLESEVFHGIQSCSRNIRHSVCWAWALEVLASYEEYKELRRKGYKFPHLTYDEYVVIRRKFAGFAGYMP